MGVSNAGLGTSATVQTSATGFNDGNWHMMAPVWHQANSSVQKLYVDGVLAGTATTDTNNWSIDQAQPIRWRWQDTFWGHYSGQMDPGGVV